MNKGKTSYDACWLACRKPDQPEIIEAYKAFCGCIAVPEKTLVIKEAMYELKQAIRILLNIKTAIRRTCKKPGYIILGRKNIPIINALLSVDEQECITQGGFLVKTVKQNSRRILIISGDDDSDVLYGVFYFLRCLALGKDINTIGKTETPVYPLRMLDHWDNLDGSIERGYAGLSIFFRNNRITYKKKRIRDYARLLSSVGINGIVLNNVNVRQNEIRLITGKNLVKVASLARIFRAYGIKVFLSINYASPMILGNLPGADPLDRDVCIWWKKKAREIYSFIPDFGGFLVKADSEFFPGPFRYNRNHAEGANMLARALKPFKGLLIWRCFVYNCLQDWRDRSTDRARAAYDNFKPLDGQFDSNVILQIKNGPVDFQVREPVSPLFGGLEKTNQMIELQITQEYTGQQKHLFYLPAQWKEILEFDTYAKGPGSGVKKIISGKIFPQSHCGIAGVSNTGDSPEWTGYCLAQANLYGFGRLSWNPYLSPEEIADEWIALSFGRQPEVIKTIKGMLLSSAEIYENYTAPLGIGWMVNPGHHYGPNVDGYEYSPWGTYHRADCSGIGIDRTVSAGTGFSGQYHKPNADMFESASACPDELLLFFHRVPYTHKLKSGKTVIQHIYDSHFKGAEQAAWLIGQWASLKPYLDDEQYNAVLKKLEEQRRHAEEWRDVINSYFFRKSGIDDELKRKIY